MPSIRQVVGAMVVGLAAVGSALPALPKMSPQVSRFFARQNPATGLPDGLGDIDILEFALTLEFLEAAFYQQGFKQFPESDFAALGLSPLEIAGLKGVGETEQAHVSLLLSAISGAGVAPVAPCTYKFGFTDAKSMVATASILENVGVSAYLGAAPLLKSASILSTAATITTVEARHQSFIRAASKVVAVPSPFDAPLGVRSVFTLAAGFIQSCPEGSNLKITPFPALTLTPAGDPNAPVAGSTVKMTSDAASGAKFCSFTAGGAPGGAFFTPFADGGCTVPHAASGIVYVHLTSEGPLTGVLTDAIIVAGPSVLQVS